MVDPKGFEPSTSRMRTERSPNWATGPYSYLALKYYSTALSKIQPAFERIFINLLIFRISRHKPANLYGHCCHCRIKQNPQVFVHNILVRKVPGKIKVPQNSKKPWKPMVFKASMVEISGIEPLTSWMPSPKLYNYSGNRVNLSFYKEHKYTHKRCKYSVCPLFVSNIGQYQFNDH